MSKSHAFFCSLKWNWPKLPNPQIPWHKKRTKTNNHGSIECQTNGQTQFRREFASPSNVGIGTRVLLNFNSPADGGQPRADSLNWPQKCPLCVQCENLQFASHSFHSTWHTPNKPETNVWRTIRYWRTFAPVTTHIPPKLGR